MIMVMDAKPSFQAYVDAIVPKDDRYGAWKYDVKEAAKTIVIFKLDPDSITPVVAKSVCLHYHIRPANVAKAVLLPKVTSGGVEVSLSFLTTIIGSHTVTCKEDVRQILDFLDADVKQLIEIEPETQPGEIRLDEVEGAFSDFIIVSPPSPEIAPPPSSPSKFSACATAIQPRQSLAKNCPLAASKLCGMVAHVCPDRPKVNPSLPVPLHIPKAVNVPPTRVERAVKVERRPNLQMSGVCPLEASKLCALIPHACPKKAQPKFSGQAAAYSSPSRSSVPSLYRSSQSSTPITEASSTFRTCPLAPSKLCGMVAHKCPDVNKPMSSLNKSQNNPVARLLSVIDSSNNEGAHQSVAVAKRKPISPQETPIAKKVKLNDVTRTSSAASKSRKKKTSSVRRGAEKEEEDGESDSDVEPISTPPPPPPRRSSARLAVRASTTLPTSTKVNKEKESSSEIESLPDDTEDDANFDPDNDNDNDRASSDEDTRKHEGHSASQTLKTAEAFPGGLQRTLQQTSRDTITSLLQTPSADTAHMLNNEPDFMPVSTAPKNDSNSVPWQDSSAKNVETVAEEVTTSDKSKGTVEGEKSASAGVLKVHASCGGTIISSQYWATPGPDKVKLHASQAIYTDKEALEKLNEEFANSECQQRADDLMNNCIKYGWALIEYLLGGRESIARSLAACSDSTSSFNTEATSNIVNTVCQAVTEHARVAFFRRHVDKFDKALFQTETRSRLFQSASFSTRVSWRPCAPQVREALRRNSKPAAGKVQLVYGFDYYISADKLAEMKKRYLDDYDGSQDIGSQASKYAMDVIFELAGDLQHIKDTCMAKVGGAIGIGKLIGDGLQYAMHSHIKEVFHLRDDKYDMVDFRRRISSRLKWTFEKITPALLASEVFSDKAESNARYDNGPPAQPGCNYWREEAPNLTRLSDKHNIYMQTLRLAEYQRYYGPEAMRQGQFIKYIHCLVIHALGGELTLHRQIADMLATKPAYSEIVSKELLDALCVHVQHLYKQKKVTTYALQSQVITKLRLIGSNIEKGACRLAYSVKDFAERPAEITSLEQAEYWTYAAPERTRLRIGRDIFIQSSFLHSLQETCGPTSAGRSINRYGFLLTMHILGGEDTVELCRKKRKIFPESIRSMMDHDALIAVCLHAEETFHLAQVLNPLFLCTDASTRLAEKRRGPRHDRQERKVALQAHKAAKKKEIEKLRKMST